jgi:hypothetical protein
LVAGRIDHDHAIRPHLVDLAPCLEDVVAQKTGFGRQVVEAVVLLPDGQSALAHVEVHHLRRAALQGHHRKRTGVGKKVEHVFVFGVVFEPLAPVGHVQKQPVVLPAHHMHDVASPLLGDHMPLRHAPGHEAGFSFALGSALEHPVERLSGGQCVPTRLQCALAQGQLLIRHRLEAGQNPHGCEPVERPVLAAGIKATTAMKHPVRIDGVAHLCDRIQEGLHGGFQ